MSKQLVIVILSVLYIGISLIVGVWFTRRQKNIGEYFLAGKSAGPLVLGIATAAGFMSGWSFIGSPGMAYQYGVGYLTAFAFIPFSSSEGWINF